jgi:hypothetical protein
MQKIVSAASKVRLTNKYNPTASREVVICSPRHLDKIFSDVLDSFTSLEVDCTRIVQGFVDNRGEFVTREEAWMIAANAGQIVRRVSGDYQIVKSVSGDYTVTTNVYRLFSENLY